MEFILGSVNYQLIVNRGHELLLWAKGKIEDYSEDEVAAMVTYLRANRASSRMVLKFLTLDVEDKHLAQVVNCDFSTSINVLLGSGRLSLAAKGVGVHSVTFPGIKYPVSVNMLVGSPIRTDIFKTFDEETFRFIHSMVSLWGPSDRKDFYAFLVRVFSSATAVEEIFRAFVATAAQEASSVGSYARDYHASRKALHAALRAARELAK